MSVGNAPVLMSEVVDLIIAQLMADAELSAPPVNGNIYPDLADESGTYPLIVVSGVTGEATRTLNQTHVWRNCTIQITARDKGGTDKSQLVLIMRRVSIILEGKRIQDGASGIYIGRISEARERPRGPDLVNDVLYPQIVVEYDCTAYRV